MMFFTVFKAPAEGRTHIFRSNEPFAQIIVIPEEASFELEKMGEEESAERDYGVVVREGTIVELRRSGSREPRPFLDRGPGYERLR